MPKSNRCGIVTDVRGGAVWVLRPELGPGRWWTSEHPERLTLVASSKEMRDRP